MKTQTTKTRPALSTPFRRRGQSRPIRPEVKRLTLAPEILGPPEPIQIHLSDRGLRLSIASRAAGVGFAIPGFGARRWFR